MKRAIFTVLLIILTVTALHSQHKNNINSAYEYLSKKGEVYFTFNAYSRSAVNNLTREISIDNVINRNGVYEVYAYANENEFNNFLKHHISYTILEHPGDAVVTSKSDMDGIEAWDFYPTQNLYISMMNQFQSQYPNLCQVFNIGNSVQNKPILMAKITDSVNVRKAKPRVLLTSSMHGDELTGYVMMLRLIDTLLKSHNTVPHISNLLNTCEIWINPLANPDGAFYNDTTVNYARRYNYNNYDLNRNFPDPAAGQYPGGTRQIETTHFMNFANSYVFTLAMNFHGGAEVFNLPWDTWARLHPDNDWYVHIAKTYVDTVHSINPTYMDDLLSGNPGIPGITNGYAWYRVTGGRQDYMNYWHGCKEVTAEVSAVKKPAASLMPLFWNYNFKALLNYIRESLYGVRGIVRDSSTNQPIKAKLYVDGFDILDTTFIWSDSIAGDYHRMLKTGNYTFRFSKQGYVTKIISNVYAKYDSTTYLDVLLRPISVGVGNENEIAEKFELKQNYPNPFNPVTTIQFVIPAKAGIQSSVKLVIYNSLGQIVESIVNNKLDAGEYEVNWNAGKNPSGVYFYSLYVDGNKLDTKKMMLIK